MRNDVIIAPSILTADFLRLGEQLREAEAAGAGYLHLDVMDGRFVPPITFGEIVVEAIRRMTSLPLDIHLMVEHPERHVEAFARAGGDILNIHVEATRHPHRVLQTIRALGKRAGVCLNPGTPVSAIEELLPVADQVMVMAVNPGWGGQSFIPAALDKVRAVRALLDERGLRADIEIDGGVKPGNAAACVAAGARVLVAGSAVFNDDGSVRDNIAALLRAIQAPAAHS
ncbi:MAG TPA: ribulose-phosphate 3-epimerase [Dehalococcoidia bacterium]|nr:ribulose-phosphate 3-epimerase [Dehalococcoidia bacterium]